MVDDAVGAGEAAADGMLLTVSYTGTLEGTGAEFDSAKVLVCPFVFFFVFLPHMR